VAPALLVLAPLRIEALALSGPPPGAASIEVRRAGMGLAKAAARAREMTHLPDLGRYSAVAVAGLGGALERELCPGDVVVADRLVDGDGDEVAKLPSATLLAEQLCRSGLRARTGTVASVDHIVTGPERASLAKRGAVAVDMESTAIAGAKWGAPLAVVRAISDSPGEELFSLAGARGVLRGLKSLHAARPALANWAAAVRPREIWLFEPRSFCAGVERAVHTVERALEKYGAPVYVRRQIVHNAHVVSRLEAAGAIFVEELSDVPDSATVVFSAHGVATSVHDEARERKMFTIDATCPLVSKVHTEVRRFALSGRQVVLVGHKGHDEVEGTLGTVPGTLLVTTAADVDRLETDPLTPTAVVTQTTLAIDEVADVVEALAAKFADLARPAASDICYASQNRQEAVRALAPGCDVVLVVGSANSSNSNRLVEVARRAGASAHLVNDKSELRLAWLTGAHRVGVSAGASAPDELVQEVVQCLSGLGPVSVSSRSTGTEHVLFPLPVEVR